ncbi:hypothetical protein MAPG_06860 [Magnaporthiopsis poae ATCC 64411]|uniref:Uncharacterized protein n=1 Tax=Magnaporthiopsis poae (strain ATCC 64411 / 73-15) TaxID=644358 RepID=A0A0C4E367_MAGP6|nr:hypothetical protein MAPG_06860 [Magnaporthiopsis poae ATCC 64411]
MASKLTRSRTMFRQQAVLGLRRGCAASRAVPDTTAGKARSFADLLARKNAPTILYEAPAHTLSRFSSYTAGVFCFVFSGYHYTTGMANPPEDIAWFVPHLYGIVVLAMGAMGTLFISGAGRIIRIISAVPRAVEVATKSGAPAARAPSPAQKAAAAATAAARGVSPIQLEVTASRYVPFLGPAVMRVDADKVVLPARLQQLREMVEYLRQGGTPRSKLVSDTTRARLAEMALRRARAEAEAKYDKEHLMTSPFRHLGHAVKEAFVATRRALTGEGFVKIKVDNVIYKLDVTSAWALDDGRALDRLVTINETMQRRPKPKQ